MYIASISIFDKFPAKYISFSDVHVRLQICFICFDSFLKPVNLFVPDTENNRYSIKQDKKL